MRHEEKIVTVSKMGQISIGKQWGGKQVRLEYTGNHIVITPGIFIPEENADFYTSDALQTLNKFESWAKTASPRKTDLKTLTKMKKDLED